MIPHCLGIDHAVINTAGRIDDALDQFARLGFRLTPRGFHSTGSVNHLMMLGPDYLELIGVPPENAALRPELANSPRGLNAIAFATDSAAGAHTALAQAKFMPQPLKALSRPVALRGNPNVVSDAGVAVMAGWASLRSAALNVYVNAGAIKDREFAEARLAELGALLAAAEPAVEEIYAEVRSRL